MSTEQKNKPQAIKYRLEHLEKVKESADKCSLLFLNFFQ